jgi:hypothetical protein
MAPYAGGDAIQESPYGALSGNPSTGAVILLANFLFFTYTTKNTLCLIQFMEE